MAWTNEYLEPALHTLVMECVRLEPNERTPGAVEPANLDAVTGLMQLDEVLAKQAYMGGAQFGIADVPTACAAYRWQLFGLDAPPLPHVQAWLAQVMPRAGFQAHVLPPEYHLR